ncbi:MAG: hypothetical protein QNJ14_17480 [Woeseiaceae bacterium]|nr:hypothetical protein [Woeseiaceae bacterium]
MRKMALSAAAVLAVIVVWVGMRLIPALGYFPPELFEQTFAPSVFIQLGIKNIVFVAYLCTAVVLFFVFFAVIQRRLGGRRGTKGLLYGSMLGVLWALAFLAATEFFDTSLTAETINAIVDLIPLALAGWLAGLTLGSDSPLDAEPASSHLIAIPIIALGFVAFHSVTVALFDNPSVALARMMFTPGGIIGYLWLAAIGAWIGAMYVAFRGCLDFKSIWANAGFFALVVVGHSWLWFNMFFNILYANVLLPMLSMWVLDILGVFVGVAVYEQIQRHHKAGVATASS